MRLLITAVLDGEPVDLAVDAEEDATVSDLASVIADAYPRARAAQARADDDGPPMLRVVSGDSAAPTLPPPPLFRGEHSLDPREPLTGSLIRHGVVLGVGAPAPDGIVEPEGLVEVRVVSGAGAGNVVRLSAGEYTIGSSPDADVRLEDAELPEHCGHLLVRADGRVEVDPAPELLGRTRPAPPRLRPLEGPIVLATVERKIEKKPKAGEPLPAGTVTADPMGDLPLVHMDRHEVTERREWPLAQNLAIGHVLLDLRKVRSPDASLSLNPAGATLDYNRPPRLLPPSRKTAFSLPNEPKQQDKPPFPLVMILVPIAHPLHVRLDSALLPLLFHP